MNDMIQDEDVAGRDKVALGILKELGIEKGKEYNPGEATKVKLPDGGLAQRP